ncbi:hypothetical protein [Magnetospira sp. QH-2]|uniref:hypothetical protein n=1 Tax=Magnetospira sp. (strain QH-2) TaxID=1288970 RepID=UPI0011DCFE75|nr:hypothetical protein [Magnetospira sp. QH-2]
MGASDRTLELDRGAYARALNKLDGEDGAAAFHEQCQATYASDHPIRSSDLGQTFFTTLPLLKPVHAAELRDLMDRDPAHLRTQDFLADLLTRVFTPALDQALTGWFASYYRPQWYSFQKFHVGDGRAYSFGWHFDAWSSHCLKLLCYLNGTGDHGGPTMVLDVAQSEAFARAGYAFPPKQQRLDDLSELASILNLSYHPQTLAMAAGEALLFNPVRLLHRGVVPTRAERYMLQICIGPAMRPWQDECQSGNWPYWDPGSNPV